MLTAVLFLAGSLIALAVIIVLLRSRARGGRAHTVTREGNPVDPIRDTEAGNLLRDFVRAAFSQGTTEEAFAAASRRLQENAAAVSEEIAHAYSNAPVQAFRLRWALVYSAARLRHPPLLPFLRQVALSTIPPEDSRDMHHFSTVSQETTIRMRAVAGFETLAASSNEAREALFECLRLSTFSLRVAAVQALIHLPDGGTYRSRVAANLPEQEQFILDIKRVDARDPERFRMGVQRPRAAARTAVAKPPLTGGRRAATSRTARQGGAPTIRISQGDGNG